MRRRDILAVVAGSACFLPLAGVAQQRATAPPPASACQERLTPDVVVMHPLPSITGPGSCGAEDVVSLDAVVLKDGQRLALAPAATLRCPMAEASRPPPPLLSGARHARSSQACRMSVEDATASRTPSSVSTPTPTHSICAASSLPTVKWSTSPIRRLSRSSATRYGKAPAAGLQPCWGRAPTAITRGKSTST